jgi:YidC/Oxa1 family membrane protein insertase
VWARRFDVTDPAWQESGRSSEGNKLPRHAVESALGMPGFTLEPGQSQTQSFVIYSGPREYSRLKRLPADEEGIMNFGTFGIVSKTLLNSMNWLHARFNSYAWAIVVLTLVIKTLLWPLQNKATGSMKRMQLLQPKMTELREKYADDPQRMNVEMMKLYKDYGVNPLSGCLPMLVQIPIFFGFYNMLGKAVELRNSKFLWVHDLSQPDTVFHLASFPVNILPLVMAGTMFWQMSISPKSGDAMQQRVFMFMPLIFIVFCYNFASALALYWTVQNLFSVVQLYATRNQAAASARSRWQAPAREEKIARLYESEPT